MEISIFCSIGEGALNIARDKHPCQTNTNKNTIKMGFMGKNSYRILN